jgi:hypothetical protein
MMNNKHYEHKTLSWNPTGKTTNSFLINKMFFYKTVFKLQLDGETFPKFLQLQLKGCLPHPIYQLQLEGCTHTLIHQHQLVGGFDPLFSQLQLTRKHQLPLFTSTNW